MYIKKIQSLKWSALLALVLLVGCQCGSASRESGEKTKRQSRDEQIENQRDFLAKERTSIEAYIKDRNLKMERTGTGLYYSVVRDSAAGENASSGDVVLIDYRISMLNGSELYNSKADGPRSIKIDKQDAEIGLHEALKHLGLGDEGLFILPSHLAFGVAGDQNKVPPVTALAYEIKVLQLEKSKS